MADTHQESSSSGADFDLSQFYQIFFEEAGENLDQMEHMLLNLNLETADDEELNGIFRCAHRGRSVRRHIRQDNPHPRKSAPPGRPRARTFQRRRPWPLLPCAEHSRPRKMRETLTTSCQCSSNEWHSKALCTRLWFPTQSFRIATALAD